MAEDATTDSTLTEGDDLTEIFRQSNVQGTYQSLSANTGFFVRGPLLKDYVPTPMKSRPKHSWVWIDKITKERRGVPITYKRTGESLWMCFHCFNKTQKALLTKPVSWGRHAQAPRQIGVWRLGGDAPALSLHRPTHMNKNMNMNIHRLTQTQTYRQTALVLHNHAPVIVSLNLLLILPTRHMLHSGTKDTQDVRPHDN